MRSEDEVRKLNSRLKRLNDGLCKQMEQATTNGEEFDNHAFAFNNNAGLICALEWVLGADTIKVTERES